MNIKYKNSTKFLQRAEITIPLGSQTFSKSKTQYAVGSSPLFATKAKGSILWDIDGNKYVDLVNSLGAITLGYNNREILRAVRRQLKLGTIFSLPGTLEAEVAELIVETVPSAELVRFAKNGSDATSAAVRLSRAYTGRTDIAFCGYHGWHDWYIGSTSRNSGVPKAVSKLVHQFKYNDIDSLKGIFQQRGSKIAAVIMEPMNREFPKNNFLHQVKKLTEKNGSILIFDETITGYRMSIGGAQLEFNVTPDLTTLGKGIANGYPLAAIVGRREIMRKMEQIFFSGTFNGELLSLAAARAVLKIHQRDNSSSRLGEIGKQLAVNVENLILKHKLSDIVSLSGHNTWKFINWKDSKTTKSSTFKSLFMQEMFKRGVLVLSTHLVSSTYTQNEIKIITHAYDEVLALISFGIATEKIEDLLEETAVQDIFKVR